MGVKPDSRNIFFNRWGEGESRTPARRGWAVAVQEKDGVPVLRGDERDGPEAAGHADGPREVPRPGPSRRPMTPRGWLFATHSCFVQKWRNWKRIAYYAAFHIFFCFPNFLFHLRSTRIPSARRLDPPPRGSPRRSRPREGEGGDRRGVRHGARRPFAAARPRPSRQMRWCSDYLVRMGGTAVECFFKLVVLLNQIFHFQSLLSPDFFYRMMDIAHLSHISPITHLAPIFLFGKLRSTVSLFPLILECVWFKGWGSFWGKIQARMTPFLFVMYAYPPFFNFTHDTAWILCYSYLQ